MDEPEKKSKWDELARELGASQPAEAAAPIAPAAVRDSSAEPRPAKREKPTAPRPPGRPKASAKDWDNLAVGLGIEPPPAPPTPPTPIRHQEGARVDVSKPAAARPPRTRPVAEQEPVEVESRAVRPEPPRAEEPEPKPPAPAASPQAASRT